MKLLILFALLSLVCSQDWPKNLVKRSYICPPNFIRQGYRCYFFSREAATWHEALFHCRDLRSNLAIIKNANQDKLVRNFLNQKTLDPVERWLGGVYDWGKMKWKWAASGKSLLYSGFQNGTKEENLRWHCIIMDPLLEYRWSYRSCVESKHYICHTKMKAVTNKGKKKLQRQYNVDKYNKLNEIPVPILPEYSNDTAPLKSNVPLSYKFEINEHLNDQALFPNAVQEVRRRARKNRRNKTKFVKYDNGTVVEVPRRKRKDRQRKMNDKYGRSASIKNIKWKTYKKKANPRNPLYPQPIVEEYSFSKD